MQFDIIHNKHLLTTFIGNKGYINRELHSHFNTNGVDAELVSVEYALNQTAEWCAQRQFFCGLSDVNLKTKLVTALDTDNWISIVDKHTNAPFYDLNQLGANCLLIGTNVIIDSNPVISDSVLLYGVFISHSVRIEPYVVVAPNTYIAFYTIHKGVHIGTGSSIIGRANCDNSIAEYSNITAHSRVSKDLSVTGTYINNRLLNSEGSMDRHIL